MENNKSRKYGLILCLLVIILSIFLFTFKLGSDAIIDYDEGIYAQVTFQTIKSDDLLTLKIDKPWFEKPPLYLWTVIASEKIFSSSEFSVRLPSAIAGILTVILVMLIMYEITTNLYVSSLGGLILTLTPTFVEAGRQLRFDVPVTLAIVLSIYSFIKARKNPWWYIGIGVGIGVLSLYISSMVFFRFICSKREVSLFQIGKYT